LTNSFLEREFTKVRLIKLEPTYPGSIPDDPADMPFEIENNVPVPGRLFAIRKQHLFDLTEAMKKMKIGQSIFMPMIEPVRQSIAVRCHIARITKSMPGKLFTTRVMKDKSEPTGLRIWLLEDQAEPGPKGGVLRDGL